MPRASCPTPAELTAFLLGDLPETELDEFAAHLEGCPRCEAAARALDGLTDPRLALLHSVARTRAAPVEAELPGRVGDYEVLGELGRGGMGVVCKAWHVHLHRVVALKVLRAGAFAEPDERRRFRAEAEAVARLQHPHIVQIFDIGEWRPGDGSPPVPYFALELVDGGSLAARAAGRPQPPRQAADWLEPLARAVHYAHTQGVVHRDLKPSNVLLTRDGQPKLCDFGVAKLLEASDVRTRSGLVIGTPEYMAPEQAEKARGPVGPAADVYALGAILYELLTGRPPFDGPTALDVVRRLLSEEALSPSRLQPGGAARPGHRLPEVPGEGAGQALRQRRGAGRRPAPLPEPRADPGPPGRRPGPAVALEPAPARAGRPGGRAAVVAGRRPGGHDRPLAPGRGRPPGRGRVGR